MAWKTRLEQLDGRWVVLLESDRDEDWHVAGEKLRALIPLADWMRLDAELRAEQQARYEPG